MEEKIDRRLALYTRMGCCNISTVTVMVVAVVLGSLASSTQAQQQDCANDLVPCAAYLQNTAQPSTNCCTAITNTVEKKLPCLCNLYFTPGLLEQLGANLTSALRIATACGVKTVDVNKCKAVLSPPPTNAPPTVPGGNGSGRIAWTGLPALLFFWVSVMLY